MADNLTTQEGVGGPVVATNEIAGVHYARSKIGHGEPGTYGDTSAANPLPVAVATLPLPAGAATQATLATIAGTVKIEDTPSATGDAGIFMLGVRQDADAPSAGTDGDYTAIKLDEAGRVKVAVQPASSPATVGTISANGGIVWLDTSRTSNLAVSMRVPSAVAGHNVAFEVSNNTTNGSNGTWYSVQAVRTNGNVVEVSSGLNSATPLHGWELSVNGWDAFRLRATAHTSGAAEWTIKPAPFATEPIPAAQVSGTQPVSGTVTATGIAGAAAHDAAISGNPVRIAGRAMTANYTPVATGDTADLLTTTVGAAVVRLNSIPELEWQAVTTLTTATAAALRAAAGAGIKAYMTGLQFQNTNATATQINILRGATVVASYFAPANMAVPATITLLTPIQTAANEALNVQAVTTGAAVLVSAQGFVSP